MIPLTHTWEGVHSFFLAGRHASSMNAAEGGKYLASVKISNCYILFKQVILRSLMTKRCYKESNTIIAVILYVWPLVKKWCCLSFFLPLVSWCFQAISRESFKITMFQRKLVDTCVVYCIHIPETVFYS